MGSGQGDSGKGTMGYWKVKRQIDDWRGGSQEIKQTLEEKYRSACQHIFISLMLNIQFYHHLECLLCTNVIVSMIKTKHTFVCPFLVALKAMV